MQRLLLFKKADEQDTVEDIV